MAEETSDRAKRADELRRRQEREILRARFIRLIVALSMTIIAGALTVFAIIEVSDLPILKALSEPRADAALPAFITAVMGLFFATVVVLFGASRSSDEAPRVTLARVSSFAVDAFLKATSVTGTSANMRVAERAYAAARAEVEKSKQEAQDFMRRPTDYIDVLTQFRLRMRGEERRLKLNSVVNLIWGILFSLLAGWWLLFSVSELKDHGAYSNMSEVIATYAPRSALAIILQLVSFFFLRLYAATEHEIKHHKNEITNMESRFAGAMFDAETSTPATRAIVLKSFMTVERNFLIKKGERTAATEVDTRYNDLVALLETLTQFQANSEKPNPKPRARKPA